MDAMMDYVWGRSTERNTSLKTMKPVLISKHKAESTYAFGDWRIEITRKSSGDGVYASRLSWSSAVIYNINKVGHHMSDNLKSSIALIKKIESI